MNKKEELDLLHRFNTLEAQNLLNKIQTLERRIPDQAGNVAFVLMCAGLVFLMVPGIGYFYSGLTGRRNALSMILLSLISVAIVSVQWFLWGYSLAFSQTSPNQFIGNLEHAFLRGVGNAPSPSSAKIPNLIFCLFQCMSAALAPVLSLGSTTQRGRLVPMIIYIFVWSTLVYDPIAYWTSNHHGWSHKLGSLDFANGTAVHISSGAAALAYSLILGKRHEVGEVDKPHSHSHMILGTSFLWLGFFGFAGGSELAANSRAAMAIIVTNLASCVGGITWMAIDYRSGRKLSAGGFCSGIIAGFTAVTPGAGFINPASAVACGIVGALVCNVAVSWKKYGRYDDSLDVFALHGVGGIAGAILAGVFAQKSIAKLSGAVIKGGPIDGHWMQIVFQLADAFAAFGYSFVVTYIILFVMNKIPGLHLRASIEQERIGMDASFIGELAYWHALNETAKFAASTIVRQNSIKPMASHVGNQPLKSSKLRCSSSDSSLQSQATLAGEGDGDDVILTSVSAEYQAAMHNPRASSTVTTGIPPVDQRFIIPPMDLSEFTELGFDLT